MVDAGLCGLLVFSPENRRYLTGFSGSNGQVWVTSDRIVLLTDGRYRAQAEVEAPHTEIVIYRSLDETLGDLLAEHVGAPVGFEAAAVTVAQWQRLTAGGPEVAWRDAGNLLRTLRMCKEEDEIGQIREAIRRAETAFDEVRERIAPGQPEREIALELEWAMRRKGAARIPFDIIVASGERSAMPHGIASNKRIEAGDALTLDFGAEAGGYFSDMTFAGTLAGGDGWIEEVIGVLEAAQQAGFEACGPGVPCRHVDAAARSVIDEAGFGEWFSHSLGHGVGLAVHEPPTVSARSEDVLEPGAVMTVEPGIYVPGRAGARIEDMVLITGEGAERLTTRPKHCERFG